MIHQNSTVMRARLLKSRRKVVIQHEEARPITPHEQMLVLTGLVSCRTGAPVSLITPCVPRRGTTPHTVPLTPHPALEFALEPTWNCTVCSHRRFPPSCTLPASSDCEHCLRAFAVALPHSGPSSRFRQPSHHLDDRRIQALITLNNPGSGRTKMGRGQCASAVSSASGSSRCHRST